MREEEPLTCDAFLALASAAGIDMEGRHSEELLFFVQDMLASFTFLREIDVAETEPVMAFIPPSD